MPKRVVIVGGGFGGLYAAKVLGRAPVAVTLVDRRNFHLFQPLLYQVATGGLSPGEIASPLRVVLRKNRNVIVIDGHRFEALERPELFADHVHLNSEGRKLFTSQFVAAVKEIEH